METIADTSKPTYIIGDVHGEFEALIRKIKALDIRSCLLICVGDLGIGFDLPKKCKAQHRFLNKFFAGRDIEFLSIRGNHDDPKYFDGSVCLSNFKLLKDYTLRNINGQEFLFVGGAVSIDRIVRRENISYWTDELLVLKTDLIVPCDVLITHSAPFWNGPTTKPFADYETDMSLFSIMKQERYDTGELIRLSAAKRHYCGHFHRYSVAENSHCISKIIDILEIIEHRH